MYTVVVLSMYGAMVMSNIIFAHGGCYVWQHGKNNNSATTWVDATGPYVCIQLLSITITRSN